MVGGLTGFEMTAVSCMPETLGVLKRVESVLLKTHAAATASTTASKTTGMLTNTYKYVCLTKTIRPLVNISSKGMSPAEPEQLQKTMWAFNLCEDFFEKFIKNTGFAHLFDKTLQTHLPSLIYERFHLLYLLSTGDPIVQLPVQHGIAGFPDLCQFPPGLTYAEGLKLCQKNPALLAKLVSWIHAKANVGADLCAYDSRFVIGKTNQKLVQIRDTFLYNFERQQSVIIRMSQEATTGAREQFASNLIGTSPKTCCVLVYQSRVLHFLARAT